jgi:hypothetical protein
MLDSLQAALSAGLATLAVFVPQLLLFLAILVVGIIIAKVLQKVLAKVLRRVGFDRLVERGGIKKALANSEYDASEIMGKVVYYFVLLFVLQLAFGVFGNNPISTLLTGIIAFLPRVFVAIVIVIITAAIAASVRELLANTLGGLSYGKSLANVAAVFLIGIGVIAALNQVGIATTVTLPILITVLATIGGILVVGIGGGLIKPMQHRLEGYLSKAEDEAPALKAHVDAAPPVADQARRAADAVRNPSTGGAPSSTV